MTDDLSHVHRTRLCFHKCYLQHAKILLMAVPGCHNYTTSQPLSQIGAHYFVNNSSLSKCIYILVVSQIKAFYHTAFNISMYITFLIFYLLYVDDASQLGKLTECLETVLNKAQVRIVNYFTFELYQQKSLIAKILQEEENNDF